MTNTKKRLGLSIPLPLYNKLLDKAKFQGKTLNSLCLDIFWEYFETKERGYSNHYKKQENDGTKKLVGKTEKAEFS